MATKVTLFSALLLCILGQVAIGEDTYKAAVVEYTPILIANEAQRINQNLENFITHMTEAKAKKVDIIAFPEYGLWVRGTYSPIPDPADRISPCDSKKFNTTQFVKDLSCAAKKHAIYTLVNLLENRTCAKDEPHCPPEGYHKYNTNIVFDRNGTVIARYAKFNLYNEPQAQKPKVADISFFDTDFGVRFGIFTSFDFHFPVPALKLISDYRITDFIAPSYWFSELPFLTALQLYRGWAETNNVNLLVPGLNYPATGTFGSGIFNGKNGQIVQVMPLKKTNQLLIGDVPKLKKKVSVEEVIIPMSDFQFENYDDEVSFIPDQLYRFDSKVIKPSLPFVKPVCSNYSFCCHFNMYHEELIPAAKNYSVRAVAFEGIREFGKGFKAAIQACGVVLCDGPDIMNCTKWVKKADGLIRMKELQIWGDFKLTNSFQIPTTLAQGKELAPLPVSAYKFTKTPNNKNVTVYLGLNAPTTNLLTFAIWGRDFTKDVSV